MTTRNKRKNIKVSSGGSSPAIHFKEKNSKERDIDVDATLLKKTDNRNDYHGTYGFRDTGKTPRAAAPVPAAPVPAAPVPAARAFSKEEFGWGFSPVKKSSPKDIIDLHCTNNLKKVFLNFYEETLDYLKKEKKQLEEAKAFFSKATEYTEAMNAIDMSIENMNNIKDMVIHKNEFTHGDKNNIKKLDTIKKWIDAINIVHPCGEIVKNLKLNIFNKDLVPIDKKYKYALIVPKASRKITVKKSPTKLAKLFSRKKKLTPIKWDPQDISMGWAKNENGEIKLTEDQKLAIDRERSKYASENKGKPVISAKKAAQLLKII